MHAQAISQADHVNAQQERNQQQEGEVPREDDLQDHYYNGCRLSSPELLLYMHNRKEKTIDKYVLGTELEQLPNGISILSAKHMISGQQFTVKRMPIETEPNSSQVKPSSDGTLYEEVKKIKDLNIPTVLKCLQVIKTKRNLYLVYERYPDCNLQEFVEKHNISLHKKLNFAKKICETLQQIHRKGYIYVSLCPKSILVDEPSQELKFVGFESAINAKKLGVGEQIKSSIQYARDISFCAPEVVNEGVASFLSDIYSAGKILEQLKAIVNTSERPSSKLINQTLEQMTSQNPANRPGLNKIWSCLKVKEDQIEKIKGDGSPSKLKLATLRKGKISSVRMQYSPEKPMSGQGINIQMPIEKRNVEDEKKCRQILKIRTLVLYLTDLANFALEKRDKELFFLLLKKAAIIRSNLIHQSNKIFMISVGEKKKKGKIDSIKELLSNEQNQSLNFLSKVEEALSAENHPHLEPELEKRNELNQSLLERRIREFLLRHKKQIKPFHTNMDQKERQKLINLCGLSEKLVYGSFEAFFDEVVDEDVLDINRQKYFCYLRNASTRELTDRLDRILKDKSKV